MTREKQSAKRKQRVDRVLVQLRLRAQLASEIRATAALEDLPVSQWIRRLCIVAIRSKKSGDVSVETPTAHELRS
jgi:hypothetical protein